MNTREVIAESARVGFEYGVITTIFGMVWTKGDIQESTSYGVVAMCVGMTALRLSLSFFVPKCEDADTDEDI